MKLICITVPELQAERDKAQAHFKERGVNAEFISGIHGVTSGLVTTFNYDYDHPGTQFNVGAKIISLAINHMMAWTACTLLQDETFLILEADAKFPEDWSARLNQALLDLPDDWDILYVGSCNCMGKNFEHVKGSVHRVNTADNHQCPQCSQAILYTRNAIRVCIATQRRFYVGVDLALIFHTLPLLKTYVILPRLVSQFNPDVLP